MTTAPAPLHPSRHARLPHVAHVLTWAVAILLGGAILLLARSDAAPSVAERAAPPARPDLQRMLDTLVGGPGRIAPGAVGYVRGPNGTWVGAAGVADVATGAPMTTAARVRLESVGKVYTATIVHQLAEEGRLRLDDTLERWLPGVLPYGERVTLTHLLTHTSGIPDDNVLTSRPAYYLSLIDDPELRAELLALARRANANPELEYPPQVWVRTAAAVPPLFDPGTEYRYSNTGFLLLGEVASRAAGRPFPVLLRERIFEPLGLRATAWDPQGPIAGPHARGYRLQADGTLLDATNQHGMKGADGGIVSNAADTARFLTALMDGRLLGARQLAAMKYSAFWSGGDPSGCAGRAFGHSGGGAGFKTNVWAKGDGTRVAVLLLNGRGDGAADERAGRALASLYCAG